MAPVRNVSNLKNILSLLCLKIPLSPQYRVLAVHYTAIRPFFFARRVALG
jgi:hypothetical protein